MKKRLAIIGSNDLAKLIAYHAKADADMEIVGFFDNRKEKGFSIPGFGAVIGTIEDVEELYSKNKFDVLMIGVGYNQFQFRKEAFDRFEGKIPFANIFHSSSYIDKSCLLGEGNFILPGTVLDAGVIIQNNVLLNTGCIIAHDSRIQSHSFIAPGVRLAGRVDIGMSCLLGIGTTVIDSIQICANTQTGGGAVVVKNIAIPGLYIGVPARLLKAF
jgi:sugar O-acyltransferase (sialic acid O-acetyltransferase NeuD family)